MVGFFSSSPTLCLSSFTSSLTAMHLLSIRRALIIFSLFFYHVVKMNSTAAAGLLVFKRMLQPYTDEQDNGLHDDD